MFKPSDTVTFKPYAPYGESYIESEDTLRSYGGQTATVLRQVGPEEADEEVGNMYEVMFTDQFTGTAFEDELTATGTEQLYRKCRDCHLFVEENSSREEDPEVAEYVHLYGECAHCERVATSHNAIPEAGPGQTLDYWKADGPEIMRLRFDS